MARPAMHEDEVGIDAELVARLVSTQFPELGRLPLRPVHPAGTVNVVCRLGDELCVRLPRAPRFGAALEREVRWLPELAPQLPLTIPEPVRLGKPCADHPLPWAVYRWIDGDPYDALAADERPVAADLARFVAALRAVDPVGAPPAGRRPLAELDEVTRAAIAASGDLVDAEGVRAVWSEALDAPPYPGAPVWIHTDLLRPNLVVVGGRLVGVLDFGGAGIGDPAADVVPAWSVFGAVGRSSYREALGVDDATWARARGYALHQALLIIPYYAPTNPPFVAMARRTVREVLADADRLVR